MKEKIKQLEKRIEALEGKVLIETPMTQEVKQVIPAKTLIWGKTSEKEMDWEDAKKWCEEQGGRMPTRVELIEAFDSKVGGFVSGYYWSSTAYESGAGGVWFVSFSDGYVDGGGMDGSDFVRCVRG